MYYLLTSGGLAQNFSPAIIDSKGALLGVARNIRVWLRETDVAISLSYQKGPFISKKGAFSQDLRGARRPRAGGPAGQSTNVTNP